MCFICGVRWGKRRIKQKKIKKEMEKTKKEAGTVVGMSSEERAARDEIELAERESNNPVINSRTLGPSSNYVHRTSQGRASQQRRQQFLNKIQYTCNFE